MTDYPTKKCPFCGERIRAEAIKCRFCREFLEDGNGLPVSYHDPAIRTVRPESPPVEEDIESVEVVEADEDDETMVVWPSLWALAGVFVKALAGIVIGGVLIGYPFGRLLADHVEVSEAVAGYVNSGTNWAGTALIAAMGCWVLYREAALKRVRYEICPDRIEFARGIFSRQIDNLDIFRIVDIKLHRSLLDCLTGVGVVMLITRDETDPEFRFEKVKDPKHLYDVIKKATLVADRKQGVVHLQ